MPPRASVRRSAYYPSREPELKPTDSPSNFQRLQLPALHGTPSSRRLYSYGSGAEPPKRPGSGLKKGQVIDLGNAVQNALSRHEKERAEEEVFVRPPRPQAQPAAADTEEDELASDGRILQRTNPPRNSETRSITFEALRSNMGTGRLPSGASDDSQRSFAMESDYYGDATIASTPGTTPVPDTRPAVPHPPSQKLQNVPEDGVLEYMDREESPPPTYEAARSMTTQNGIDKPFPRLEVHLRSRQSPQGEKLEEDEQEEDDEGDDEEDDDEEEEDQDESEEVEPIVRGNRRDHSKQTNMPAPNRDQPFHTRELRTRQGTPRIGETRMAPTIPEMPLDPVPPRPNLPKASVMPFREEGRVSEQRAVPSNASKFPGTGQRRNVAKSVQDPRKALNAVPDSQPRATIFTTAKAENRTRVPPSASSTWSDDETETDTSIQRERQEAEARAARERKRREKEAEVRRERWRQRWAWFLSLWSLDPLRRRIAAYRAARIRVQPTVNEDYEDELDDLGDAPLEWWQLFNPLTYLQMLVSLVDAIMDRVVTTMDQIAGLELRQRFADSLAMISWAVVGIIGLSTSFVICHYVYQVSWLPGDIDLDPILSSGSVHWLDLSGFKGKIGSIIPSMPTISWPSWDGADDDSSEKWELGDNDDWKNPEQYLEKYEKDLNTLKKADKLHRDSIKKLEGLLPKIVHMELKNGRPVITQEFLHALRDLLREDGGFLNLEKKGNIYDISSEQQWRAIPMRLIKDPAFANKLNLTASELDRWFDTKVQTSFDSWIKNNDDKVAKILGPALDKIQAAGSGREFDKRFSKMVKGLLQGNDLRDTVVSRDEFLRHLGNELRTHRGEVRAELNELRPQLEDLIRESIRIATQNTPQALSRGDIITLVQDLVRKAIADLNLKALAKGQIHRHWDAELQNQVNYFSIGSGATIDAARTSLTFDPKGKGTISEEAFAKGVRGAAPYPAIAALVSWQDEGDCWCAARSLSRRGNPHGATLSIQLAHLMIPQHVVIEHILPGATIDPNARPKDIEVYASIADPVIRERLFDFGAAHFPEDTDSWDFTPVYYGPEFVKIGQFRYESAELHGGVHVHRLSSELSDLRAETDQVIIRAVSNYGAEGHTCFYRARLFGEKA